MIKIENTSDMTDVELRLPGHQPKGKPLPPDDVELSDEEALTIYRAAQRALKAHYGPRSDNWDARCRAWARAFRRVIIARRPS